MTRRRWIADETNGNTAALTGDHAVHLTRVLRAGIGQEFDISTGTSVRRGTITSISEKRVEFVLGEEQPIASAPDVTLALAIFKFDRKTGAPKGEIKIPGSSFLNDLASDGPSVYVSDSGLKAGAGGSFEPSGTDAVWKIVGNKAQRIASGPDLKRPNGVDVVNGKVWVVTFGADELYQLDNGKKTNVATLPKGSLDGLVHLDDGSFVISSWDGKAIYRGPQSGPFTAVLENINAPADIGYDAKRQRLLVPHFMDSIVTIHPMP